MLATATKIEKIRIIYHKKNLKTAELVEAKVKKKAGRSNIKTKARRIQAKVNRKAKKGCISNTTARKVIVRIEG